MCLCRPVGAPKISSCHVIEQETFPETADLVARIIAANVAISSMSSSENSQNCELYTKNDILDHHLDCGWDNREPPETCVRFDSPSTFANEQSSTEKDMFLEEILDFRGAQTASSSPDSGRQHEIGVSKIDDTEDLCQKDLDIERQFIFMTADYNSTEGQAFSAKDAASQSMESACSSHKAAHKHSTRQTTRSTNAISENQLRDEIEPVRKKHGKKRNQEAVQSISPVRESKKGMPLSDKAENALNQNATEEDSSCISEKSESNKENLCTATALPPFALKKGKKALGLPKQRSNRKRKQSKDHSKD